MQRRFVLESLKILLLIALTSSGFAQVKPAATPLPASPSPGNIQLPENYRYERRMGKDSSVGALVRADGFTIGHDIGRMAGNYAHQYFPENFERIRKQTHLNQQAIEREIESLQSKIQWRQRQKLNGDEVMVVMLKDSTLIASFVNSTANFTAKADTADKIADFFLIVLTYQPPVENRK